jgi:high-affinity K+ transport system ATPase subunit B
MDLQELNQAFLNDAQVRDYYRKLSPTYNPHKPLTTTGSTTGSTKGSGDIKISDYSNNGNNDVLLNKLNYMINLLENQQDERTNNVTEEVVLYSFLGVFIIFVVDSFARVGKYVR